MTAKSSPTIFIAALLCLLAGAAQAAIAPRPSLEESGPSWTDRGRRVEALPSARGAAPGLLAIRLRYDDGRTFDAEVDDTAIVGTRDVDALAREYSLRPVRLLLKARGLWLVRGLPGEDGVSIAARLSRHARAGGLIESVVPNLYLAHRFHVLIHLGPV